MSRVLIGCEFSGVMRRAFAAHGHDVWSCDLLPSDDSSPNHLQCDVEFAIQSRRWDFIGIHLPCTSIALSGNPTYGRGKKKHSERLESMTWTQRVFELAKANSRMGYFENPKNIMPRLIGKFSQRIQPYQYGHMEQKETWLWTWGLPPLIPSKDVFREMMKLPKKDRERIFYMPKSKTRGHQRSISYTGIAEAMAAQWSNPVYIQQSELFT